jgi:sec-independent protein translocase protein TatC
VTETRRWTPQSARRARQERLADGANMSLAGHLHELRNRIIISVVAISLLAIVGWVFYDPIFSVLADPYRQAAEKLGADGETVLLVLDGIAAPLVFQLKISFVVGVVLASPIWLYQIWAFITPGLHTNERKWTFVFVGTATPLFLAGAALAYFVLPKGITLLLGFTPENVTNLNNLSDYLSFIIRMLLVFGLAFELPLFIVLLNFAGLVTGAKLSSWRRGIIFAIFVFAAVGTPTGDPITMLLLAIPMWLLFEAAVFICRVRDRRRQSEEPESYDQWADDEQSPI